MLASRNYSNLRPALIIAAFAVLLFIPAFLLGAGGNDLHCQSLWVRNFSMQFWDGELYPRWMMDMYAGNGSPVFFYYPPFAYYVSALLYPLLPHDDFTYLPMAVSALIATAASGITFFIWMRRDADDNASLIGSLLYMSLPLHVGLNFYGVLLYSTLWAYAWLPLMLLSARAIAEGKKIGIVMYALSLSLMITTNLPSTMICGPLSVLYAGFYCDRHTIKKTIAKGGAAIFLGFGLSAIFLFPSLAYLSYTMVDLHWYKIPAHLFEGSFRRTDPVQFTCDISWLVQAVLLASCYVMTKGTSSPLRMFFLTVSAFTLLMTTTLSRWLWEHIFILQPLQEPGRLFIITTLALAGLLAIAARKYKKTVLLCVIACTALTLLSVINTRVTMQSFAQNKPDFYARYGVQIDQYAVYLGYADLIHRYYDKDSIARLKAHPEQAYVIEGDAKFQITRWKPRDIEFTYTAKTASRIQIRQSYFPGWQAFLNEQLLYTAWDKDSGGIIISLPPGSGTVELELTRLWPEYMGRLISMLSVGILLIFFLYALRDYNEMKPQQKK